MFTWAPWTGLNVHRMRISSVHMNQHEINVHWMRIRSNPPPEVVWMHIQIKSPIKCMCKQASHLINLFVLGTRARQMKKRVETLAENWQMVGGWTTAKTQALIAICGEANVQKQSDKLRRNKDVYRKLRINWLNKQNKTGKYCRVKITYLTQR